MSISDDENFDNKFPNKENEDTTSTAESDFACILHDRESKKMNEKTRLLLRASSPTLPLKNMLTNPAFNERNNTCSEPISSNKIILKFFHQLQCCELSYILARLSLMTKVRKPLRPANLY